ncbi:MAG: carbohydrate binding family 9 domain-containing protein [Calditrichaeota bacterium]|nr:carbohydrate binding family 9 domain-containing protein [Calditrichota bacterium]MCB9369691.1 carbohydrate binding family 9 domain-containing protein [Calditrichota bacterium]
MPLLAVLFLMAMFDFAWADAEGYEIWAGRRSTPITLDGRIESAWLSGGKAENFIQREPGYPAPATQKSEVFVLYDEKALYVAYMLYDTAPDSVFGQIQRRDNDANSDFVDLYIDTFHDRRSGYWFTITAAGVQSEGTFYNENNLSNAWDAVWESAVARTDSGWSCEVRIPFQILRHGGPREDGWGIAFARKLFRLNEANFWPPVDPEVGWRASAIGTLRGLENIAPSAHVELLPHVVGRWDAPFDTLGKPQDFRSKNEWENLGLTAKYVPSAALSFDGAYQPDFAQVDVDEAVINLTDYPVFLSEKRPFFLENKEYFEETPYTFVYTRRVTDPDYGARVNAQKGNFKLSAFGGKNRLAYTDESDTLRFKLQDAAFGRASVDIKKRHRIGLTWTYLNQTGYSAATAGVDAKFRFRERDRLWFWLAGVERSGYPEQHWWRVDKVRDEQPIEARASYGPDLGPVRTDLAFGFRGKDYDTNDLGWGDATNGIRQSWWLGDNYYLKRTFLRNIGFDLNEFYTSLTDGKAPEGYGNWDFYATSRKNWDFGGGMEWGTDFRRVYQGATGGEFRDNYGTFDHEFYRYFHHWAWIWNDNTKPFRYGFDVRYRSFRDGYSFGFEPETSWRPRSNIELDLRNEWTRVWSSYSFVDDSGNVVLADFRNWIFKANWSPSLHLSFRATVQWIEKSYYESDEGLSFSNLLMAYNWIPGSWFYLVYDEAARDIDRPEHPERSIPGERTIRAKLTYFFTVP